MIALLTYELIGTGIAANVTTVVWPIAAAVRRHLRGTGRTPPGIILGAFRWLRPFYMLAVLVESPFDAWAFGSGFAVIIGLANLAAWFTCRNDRDDDERKRRARRRSDRVARVGGRLAVVPANAE